MKKILFLVLLPHLAVAAVPSGKTVYENTCRACHQTGVAGAPRLDDKASWNTRLRQGEAMLVEHARSGIRAMPARGGNAALSDAEVTAAVRYMAATAAKGVSAAPPPAPAPAPYFQTLARGERYNFPVDANGYFAPPRLEDAPLDKFGDEVRLGYKIFTETQTYAGRYAGRGLACSSCHLDAGRRPNAIPMWGAGNMYPVYRHSDDRADNLVDRVQSCFVMSMNGLAPAPDAPEMRAVTSYIMYLSKGAPIGVSLPGRSMPEEGLFALPKTGYEPSPTRGARLFATKCAACHGEDGHGKKGADGRYAIPPLWGWDSYNKGASMTKDDFFARFIKANMPKGQEGTLTAQEAWDIATFVNIHERPLDPSRGLLSNLLK